MTPLANDMHQERWNRLEALFTQALERPADEQARFLAAECDDAGIRAEVLAMLASHEDSGELKLEHLLVSEEEATDAPGLPPGARIGPYRILSLAGRGGMGEVYCAERADGEFEQLVAIKLLRPGPADADVVQRFRVERSLLARLVHPNIATILDGGTTADGRPYLVLRFIDGEPLTRFAERLPLRDRVRLLAKVADAVQFAHAHLIVHRDLKPSNILVTAQGEPVLLDFGIAKLLESEGGDLTQTGRMLLTPSRAAPEQLRGDPATTATDVYGLGGLLFELVTGRRCFAEHTTTASLERAIRELPVPQASGLARPAEQREVKGDLDRILQMALRKEPERRYQSAGQFAEDLVRWLSGRPVIAQPDTFRYRARKFVARNRAAVAAGLAFLALGIAFGIREVRQARQIAAERDNALREQAAGEDVVQFVTDLFRQSDPRVVPGGDTVRIGLFLTRAEAQAAGLEDQPERQVRVYRALGNVRWSRGDYPIADSLFRHAIAIGGQALGAEHLEVLRTEHLRAQLLGEWRGSQVGRPALEGVLQRLRRRLGQNHPDVAQAYLNLAGTLEEPARIRELLDSTVAIRIRLGRTDSVELAAVLDQQAVERGTRGRFAEAVSLDEAALRILESRLEPNHTKVLSVKGNLAIWLGRLARWDRAVPLAENLLETDRSQTTAGTGLAMSHERVATLEVNLPGRLAHGETLLREALRIYRAAVAPEHNLITNTTRNLAIVIALQGRVSEGLALLDSAIARSRAAGDEEGAAYMTGQRVPMLVRLGPGRVPEAVQSAGVAAAFRDRLPKGSTRGAEIQFWSGMAALAAGRAGDAVRSFRGALEETQYPGSHPRLAMYQCALGAALAQSSQADSARSWDPLESTCRHASLSIL